MPRAPALASSTVAVMGKFVQEYSRCQQAAIGRGIVSGLNTPNKLNAVRTHRSRSWRRPGGCVLIAVALVGMISSVALGDPIEESTSRARVATILQQAPADSVAILYSQDLAPLGGRHLLAKEGLLPAQLDSLLRVLLRPIDREVMVAVSGAPPNPFNTRITIVGRTAMSHPELFKYIDEELVPKLSELGEDTSAGFWESDGVGHLTLAGTLTLSFDVAWRDGLFVLSNVMGQATAFASGERTRPAFVETTDFERITFDDPNTSTAHLLYINLRPWVGLAQAELNDSLPELYEATQLDRVQFVALQQTETQAPATPFSDAASTDAATATRKNGGTDSPHSAQNDWKSRTSGTRPGLETRWRQFMHLGLTELAPGPWRWLGSTPTETDLADSFPPDTILLVGSGMKDGREPWSNAKTFVGTFAPEIVAEYEQEREEFRRDIGFDPESEFLANFDDAWALGVVGGETTGTLVAIKLKSASTFRAHLHQLRSYFDFKTDSVTYRGVTIEEALRPGNPFYYALADDLLLLAGHRQIITRAIDAREDDESLATTDRFRRAHKHAMARTTSKSAFVNFVELLSDAIPTPDVNRFPELKEALLELQALAIAVTPRDDAIQIEWSWGAQRKESVSPILVETLVASLRSARAQAERTIAMAHTRSIVTACHVYAQQNKNHWPGDLHELAGSGALGTLKEAGRILADPYNLPDEVVRIMPWYLYRPVADFNSIEDPASVPVVCEPAIRDGGLVVGFADAHVEWVPEPRAGEILKSMQSDG